ncbi:MAG: energy transducer TonB [Bacteroidetes bacterium]|nr:energy transducer TonB [Bacteroidota bacterium]
MKFSAVVLILLLSVTSFAQADTASVSLPLSRHPEGEKIFTVVEQMPGYPGGEPAMMQFLKDHIRYPSYERKHKIEGRVIVGFEVNEDGTLSDIVVKKGVSAGIDAEAVRVIKLLPPFQPGRQKGKPVKVSYLLPIMFRASPAQ